MLRRVFSTRGTKMPEQTVNLDTWPRAEQFRFFRTFERPHYAVTSRVDVTGLMQAKARGISAYRACLYAIGAGLQAVPELRMRFRRDDVVLHDTFFLSMTVPTQSGTFDYAYVKWIADWSEFDASSAKRIAAASQSTSLNPNAVPSDAVAYLSCMPWMDYTSINNAMPGPDDCIPRISWGKFVDHGDRWDMAMTLEVHHALVDGEQVGAYFAAVQAALETV